MIKAQNASAQTAKIKSTECLCDLARSVKMLAEKNTIKTLLSKEKAHENRGLGMKLNAHATMITTAVKLRISFMVLICILI